MKHLGDYGYDFIYGNGMVLVTVTTESKKEKEGWEGHLDLTAIHSLR